MVEQMNQPMILQQPPSLSIKDILQKSFNDKSMVLNMFLVLIPFCLMVLGADLTFVRVLANIVTPMELLAGVDPSSLEAKEMVDGILKNVWLLLGLELFFIAFFSIASLLSIIVIVCISPSSSSTNSQKRLNVKELFMKTGRPWMRQVITWLYVTSIMLVAIGLVLISIGVLSVRVTGVALIISCIFLVILGTLSYAYLAAVWMLSMVMSIAYMDFNQVLIPEDPIEGRRLQGFVLVLSASAVGIGIYVAFAFGTRNINQGIDTRSANGIVMLCYLCLMKLFMFMLYCVYYNEFKRRNNGGQRLGYAPIPAV